MEAPIKKTLPLISARINFAFKPRSTPPEISARMNFANKLRRSYPLPVNSNQERFSIEEDIDMSDTSDLTDILEDELPDDQFKVAIPTIAKPPGEPGRPQSGGYSLPTILDWNEQLYKKVVVSNVHRMKC